MTGPDPYTSAAASAARIAERTGVARHDIAIVLGSGWAPAAAALGEPRAEIAFADLGGYPTATVPGHAGVVRSIAVGESNVLAFLGRVHLYEGHDVSVVVHGVRTAVLAGCKVVILTNAAGGLEGLHPGQPVLIRDHINLTAKSPLEGPNPPEPYPIRFVDLTELYSRRLRALVQSIDPSIVEGVYAAFPGPHYETPAEIAMVRTMGGHLVGMSTALEAIAARHLGAEVLAMSLVTNPAAGISGEPLDHAEVVATGRAAAERMGVLLHQVVLALS
jgi:purine-nucleoside phosphorylase